MERRVRRRALIVWTAALGAACGSHTPRLNVGPVPPGVYVDARIHFYDVTAATLFELRRGMAQLGPRWEGRTWSATAHSEFRWTYDYDRVGITCSLRRVRVQVRTVVTFPRWNPSADPDSATVEWWYQLNAGLMEHERGHALLSVNTAGEIVRALELVSHPQCDAAGQLANATGQRIITVERRHQVDYDRTTRHGATQIEQAGRLRAP